MIRKLLVANRGEIARRIFRTCRRLGIATVAVFTASDELAPHVSEADVAVRIDSYLNVDQIVAAARAAGADAIHPGYGFLSENAGFARGVLGAGLIWIGPAADAIEVMGDKIQAKKVVSAAGVPVLGGDQSFPLLIKAAAGGGGRGMRVVTSADTLRSAMLAAEAEAQSAFGDGTVFTEPYLPNARHVEVQVLGDARGRIWIVGDRDCSVQRRHQKIIEEAPAPGLTDPVRSALHRHARAAAEAVDYQGAGTVEFLVDGERIFFLEMNTRLQVEHPVTEAVTGLDLVAWQLAIAEGRELPSAPPPVTGHAIEVRLYAEDPARDFTPQTGRIRAFDFGTAPDVRVDSGVEAGTEVGIHYDAMISKIISYGTDRSAAIRLLADTLRRGVVHGVTTNLGLLRAILADEDFVAGRVDTALLDRRLTAWLGAGEDHAVRKAALAAAVGSAVRTAASGSVQARIPAAWRNVPSRERVRAYRYGGATFEVGYLNRGGRLESSWLPGVSVLAVDADRVVLDDHGVRESYRVTVVGDGADVHGPDGAYDFEGVPVFTDPAANVAAGSLLASTPGLVVAVHVAEGDQVAAGAPIVVLEAMKMQQTLVAPGDGVVGSLSAVVGRQVAAGDVLAVISSEEST
ncbi:acetyl/propionyl/methylcrotonyl-CoA carboxylase subunit alpha [Actinoplanes awajinensis]|uniref:Acetyl/propionyl-CoA carboxylase subuit alpha n=1 Tax=Actinoplanes awajinensis subsp. mycoplanecinus TaxID=135947 RepID=A0A101JEN4_9ACTN|nr:biotin carboxylase N-terminal domain-containing protein [Actinoplanes awajinensis]KUL25428.1 acetyl/propionyl-CoA carboxylase subuit alpha [Actinoplanes awajinensis subsp. mycoplanecinus]